MRRTPTLAVLILAGCDGAAPPARAPTLEQAAIARGMIPDPAVTPIAGVFARDGDRLCIVPDESGARIGVTVDYGDDVACVGRGTVRRAGAGLRVTLGSGCAFDAGFDGERISFPGTLPEDCARSCEGRASLAGLRVSRLSDSIAEARATRARSGQLLCAAD